MKATYYTIQLTRNSLFSFYLLLKCIFYNNQVEHLRVVRKILIKYKHLVYIYESLDVIFNGIVFGQYEFILIEFEHVPNTVINFFNN